MSNADASDAHGHYVAEYVDGPLEGTTEHRVLHEGAPEQRITQYALVDGTDAAFGYTAGDAREINGETFVRYSFDQAGSDPLQGDADPDQESIEI